MASNDTSPAGSRDLIVRHRMAVKHCPAAEAEEYVRHLTRPEFDRELAAATAWARAQISATTPHLRPGRLIAWLDFAAPDNARVQVGKACHRFIAGCDRTALGPLTAALGRVLVDHVDAFETAYRADRDARLGLNGHVGDAKPGQHKDTVERWRAEAAEWVDRNLGLLDGTQIGRLNTFFMVEERREKLRNYLTNHNGKSDGRGPRLPVAEGPAAHAWINALQHHQIDDLFRDYVNTAHPSAAPNPDKPDRFRGREHHPIETAPADEEPAPVLVVEPDPDPDPEVAEDERRRARAAETDALCLRFQGQDADALRQIIARVESVPGCRKHAETVIVNYLTHPGTDDELYHVVAAELGFTLEKAGHLTELVKTHFLREAFDFIKPPG